MLGTNYSGYADSLTSDSGDICKHHYNSLILNKEKHWHGCCC